MGDQVEREARVAVFADEVALEEGAAGDEVAVCEAAEEGDTDVGREVDQFGVLEPGAGGDHNVAAGAEVGDGFGEDAGEAEEQAVEADLGEVAAVEDRAVAVVAFVDAIASRECFEARSSKLEVGRRTGRTGGSRSLWVDR
ncbi:hypothetical protein ACFWPK_12190 [Nocardia sp. NPDC058519]|uniref:hypothetical protein n=1 Tax=Nocardia sp. NPDC058519 TaxID=3346535 RepID=UPI00365160BB